MKEDLSGQKNILSNLSSGWIANGAQIISGFILPRLISDRLGQDALGVWDFGWAVVSYFALLQGGIVSSVNRYVAKYRAVGDHENLNIAVNSVGAVLKGIAIIIAVLAVAAAWAVPHFMAAKLAGLTTDARWIVLLLGLTAAIEVQGSVYGGVLTGCHRWTVHNGIKSGAALFSLIGGIAVILLGGTIAWLAGVMLLSEVVLRLAQSTAARRVCPELHFSLRHFRAKTALEMSHFGGKTYVNVISQMLVNQTSSLFVASTCGVGALAIFSRPRSLVRALSTAVANNASVMVPMVSALDADGKTDEVRHVTIVGTRYAAFACLPALLVLTTMGGQLMRVWMGANYVDVPLLGIFALSGLIEASYFPLQRTLMGLNRHGRFGLLNVASGTISAAAAAITALWFHGGLHAIAIAVVVPAILLNAVVLPTLCAKVLRMSVVELLLEVWTKPALCCLPAAICLVGPAFVVQTPSVPWLALECLAAVLVSGWMYWRHAIPTRLKPAMLRA